MTNSKCLDFEVIAETNAGTAFASSFINNGLYEVNLCNGKSRYIMLFPNENIDGKRIHSSAVYHDSKVYFIPMSGEYISIFDVNKRIIDQIVVPQPSKQFSFYKYRMKFIKGIYYDGYIYMIPFTYPGILKLNTKTSEIIVINDWIPQEGYFFRGGACIDQFDILVPSGINNIILEFNLGTEQAIIHHVGTHNNGSMCVCKYMDYYIIAPRLFGSVIIWNIERNEIFEITEYPKGFKSSKIIFSEIIPCMEKLFLMPASANTVLSINEKEKKLEIEDNWKPLDGTMTACMFETDEYYYFREKDTSSEQYRRYRIRKKDGFTESYLFTIENIEEYDKDYWNYYAEQKSVMMENENFELESFLLVLRSRC